MAWRGSDIKRTGEIAFDLSAAQEELLAEFWAQRLAVAISSAALRPAGARRPPQADEMARQPPTVDQA